MHYVSNTLNILLSTNQSVLASNTKPVLRCITPKEPEVLCLHANIGDDYDSNITCIWIPLATSVYFN